MLMLKLISLLATAGAASAAIIGEAIHFDYNKTAGPEGRVAARALTNAERFAAGMVPAMPRSLPSIPRRSRKQATRASRTKQRRQDPDPPTQSGSPGDFPDRPVQDDPQVIFNTPLDDRSSPVTLPFSVDIFDATTSTIYVTENGYISTSSSANPGHAALWSDYMNVAAVMPYWTDLIIRSNTNQQTVTVQNDESSVSIRWRLAHIQDSGTIVNLDFTASLPYRNGDLYYSTATPGQWFAYYDYLSRATYGPGGSAATIGAQGSSGPKSFVQYSFDTDAVQSGTVLTFDTRGAGSVTVGQFAAP